MTTKNISYFFRLTPIDKFFFGNERTFGQGEEANYFVRSNSFPQQTSILGMLRFELLKNGIDTFPINSTNKENVEARIGKESFNHEDSNQLFGIIDQISPVFICKGDSDVYFSTPKNWHFEAKDSFEGKAYRIQPDGKMKEMNLPLFPEFDHKKHFSQRFQNLMGEKLGDNQIFIEINQIGIQKPKKDDTKDESNKGFYKQYSYSLQKDFSFCFWAKFSETINWQPSIVYLGADKSAFRIEVTEADWESDYKKKYEVTNANNAIYLLSDAFVSDDFYNHCQFAITDVVDFRYIKSDISTTDYSSHNPPKKVNIKLHLLERGSVIYPDNLTTDLFNQLNNDTFKKIGYNIFKNL